MLPTLHQKCKIPSFDWLMILLTGDPTHLKSFRYIYDIMKWILCWQAYGQCKTDGEKTSLLSTLLIRRGEGVTSTTRRVGPELSKRLFVMMTSCDPQQSLDSTV